MKRNRGDLSHSWLQGRQFVEVLEAEADFLSVLACSCLPFLEVNNGFSSCSVFQIEYRCPSLVD